MDVVFLLGADEIEMKDLGEAFVIYIGHHGDDGANRANVILPGAAYTEKNATFVNLEGRVQRTQVATLPLAEAREDWAILRALSAELNATLPFDSLHELRENMVKYNPSLGRVNQIMPSDWGLFGKDGQMTEGDFINAMDNFFMTDPISRASLTMAACAKEKLKNQAADIDHV